MPLALHDSAAVDNETKFRVRCAGTTGGFPGQVRAAQQAILHTYATKTFAGQVTTISFHRSPAPLPNVSAARSKKTLWEALDEIWAEVPDEEWRKLPVDLAAQHDHYIYGSPKKRL